MQSVYNFSAGPTALPHAVMQNIQAEFLDYSSAKAGVIEISHRSKEFMDIYHGMQFSLRTLMNIPHNYQILFTAGGAALQFAMVPLNLSTGVMNYANTGHWSTKAIAEAKRYGNVNIVTDSTDNNFTTIADFASWNINEDASYLHYCSNETIAGLEFDYIPQVDMPLVCDMSSNILSKAVDISKYGIIYAGAQKNIGASGLTVVIIREDLIGHAPETTPKLLNYSTYAQSDSMFNTPVTFAWYSAYKVFQWLEHQGIEHIYSENTKKAQALYDYIDASSMYSNPVEKRYRSQMNVPFILASDNLNATFLEESYNNNLLALKGHKSVGGMRASIYNAMPYEGVLALIDFMKEFERTHG